MRCPLQQLLSFLVNSNLDPRMLDTRVVKVGQGITQFDFYLVRQTKRIVLELWERSTYILLQSLNYSQCSDQRIKNQIIRFVKFALREVKVEGVQQLPQMKSLSCSIVRSE